MSSGEALSPPGIKGDGRAATLVIAGSAGVTSMAFNVWYPFMPLYALELGASSDANAVFWVAVAITAQGVTRLASSAVWGVLSDRFGRKLMLLRSLYLASLTFAVAAFASEPWHLGVALGCQGFFSGFVPASVALVSVSVPDSRLNSSLAMVTGVQYLGSTTGPALGAGLALAFGYRGSIAVAALVPLIAATAVLFLVPRDEVTPRATTASGSKVKLEPFKMTGQFVLAVSALFCVYSMNELIRLATPIALRAIEGHENVAGVAGLTFSLGGLISAVSVLLLSPWLFRRGRLRLACAAACAVGATGFFILAGGGEVALYVLGFLLVAVVVSSMVPAMNTQIAANAARSRRGTAFGIAASVQAFSFGVGPLGAAFFAGTSLELGFAILGCVFLVLGMMLALLVREPAGPVGVL
ncbi:MAG TPA: MFS transporter [Dehalococcoidia bacterium]|nr:MFS transporter [Dehalococcoidia bacterium]